MYLQFYTVSKISHLRQRPLFLAFFTSVEKQSSFCYHQTPEPQLIFQYVNISIYVQSCTYTNLELLEVTFLICFFFSFPLRFHCKRAIHSLGGIEKPKHPKSIIGLFRRESSSSTQGAVGDMGSDSEGAKDPKAESAREGPGRVAPLLSKRSTSLGGPSVLLMEDVSHSDPLGASSRPASIMQGPHRGQCRRGSMLELTG